MPVELISAVVSSVVDQTVELPNQRTPAISAFNHSRISFTDIGALPAWRMHDYRFLATALNSKKEENPLNNSAFSGFGDPDDGFDRADTAQRRMNLRRKYL